MISMKVRSRVVLGRRRRIKSATSIFWRKLRRCFLHVEILDELFEYFLRNGHEGRSSAGWSAPNEVNPRSLPEDIKLTKYVEQVPVKLNVDQTISRVAQILPVGDQDR